MAWTNSYSITIDHTKVGLSDSVNFPLAFWGRYPNLRSVANGGVVQNPPYDIIFAQNSDGTSPLNFERVGYDVTTGRCEFWIQIPTLSHTADTTIYILAGNSAVTTDQQNSAVWDSGFQGGGVYHYAGSTLVTTDSTAAAHNQISGNNGYTLPTVGPIGQGQLGYGASFNGNQGVNYGSQWTFASANFTASAWVNPTNLASRAIIGAVTSSGFEFRIESTGKLTVLKQSVAQFASSTGSIVANAPSHVAVTCTSAGAFTYYINGIPSGSGTGATFSAVGQNVGISSGGENWLGVIEEVHISNSVRSADWLLAEYNNQSVPWTFYSTTLAGGSPAFSRVTTVSQESIITAIPGVRNTWLVAESLVQGGSSVRNTWLGAEVIVQPLPAVRNTWLGVEIMITSTVAQPPIIQVIT